MRTATPVATLGVIVMIAVFPAPGSAFVEQDDVEEPSVQDDAEELTVEQKEEARHHFISGGKRYKEGEYQAAIDHFELAYDITHASELLYNIGRCRFR